MTEAEEAELQERLKKAYEIKAEITSIKEFIDLGQEDGTIYTTIFVKDGKAFREVVSLSNKTRQELNEAVILTLKSRLIELEEEYDKC